MASTEAHNQLRQAVRRKQRRRYKRDLRIRAKRDRNINPVCGIEASRVATDFLKSKQ